MTDTIAQFRESLESSWLRGRRTIPLPVPNSSDWVFAVEIAEDDLKQCWQSASLLSERTNRWPVVAATVGHGKGRDWASAVRAEDFFNRFEHANEPGGETGSEAIRHEADAVDVPSFLLQLDVIRRQSEAELKALAQKYKNSGRFCSYLESELGGMRQELGAAPSVETAGAAVGAENTSNAHVIERYLMEWEIERGYRRDPETARMPWFDVGEHGYLALLFLPTRCSWDALAYLHWFGVSRFRSADAIALGRSWRERFGAELVAHYGTMLQCVVSRPPVDLEAAWVLAREHDLLSPGTIAPSGTRLRHYARGLIGFERWFLHERP